MVDGIREEAGIWSLVGFLLLDVAWWHNPSVFIMLVLSLLHPLKSMLGWSLSPPEQRPHLSAQQPHAVVSFPVFSLYYLQGLPCQFYIVGLGLIF
jgi:hypothetical protein